MIVEWLSAVAWLLLSVVTAALLQFGIRARQVVLRRWLGVKATVVRCHVESAIGGLGRPLVVYEYSWANHHFLGQYRPWDIWWGWRIRADATAREFPTGSDLSVLVNPDNHQISVVLPWPRLWLRATLLVLSLVALVMAVNAALPILRYTKITTT